MKVLLTTLLLGIAPLSGSVVYTQPFNATGNVFASQNNTNGGGLFAQVYDDFTLGSATSITDVHWTGAYFNPNTPGTTTAWTVGFYDDNAGQPGALISSQVFSNTGNETSLGTIGGLPTFSYSVILSTPFSASAGTQYWLSVYPDLGLPPQWGWAEGSGGDGISYQDFIGSRFSLSNDMAFDLTGTPLATPEPATMAFAGSALAALVLLRRKKA